jgi:hypothetical protein
MRTGAPVQTLLTFFAEGISVFLPRPRPFGEIMTRHRKDLGGRKYARVELHKPGYLILAPDAPWIECLIIDVSESGVCLEVGALAVPELFGLAFTAAGQVLRVCSRVWRRGQLVGARFVSAKELRMGVATRTQTDRNLEMTSD